MGNFEFLPSGWTVSAALLIAALLIYFFWDRISAAGKRAWEKASQDDDKPKQQKGKESEDKITSENIVWIGFFLFWVFMLVLLGMYIYHFAEAAKIAKSGAFTTYMHWIYGVGGVWTALSIIMFFSGEVFDSLLEWLGVYLVAMVMIVAAISFVAMLIISFKSGLLWGGGIILSAMLATGFYRWNEKKC